MTYFIFTCRISICALPVGHALSWLIVKHDLAASDAKYCHDENIVLVAIFFFQLSALILIKMGQHIKNVNFLVSLGKNNCY